MSKTDAVDGDLLCIVTGRWWCNIQRWDGGLLFPKCFGNRHPNRVAVLASLRTVAVLRYGQYDSDGILVFPGNGKRFAGDFDDVGRGEHRFRHVDKEGTVNAQEADPQKVLP